MSKTVRLSGYGSFFFAIILFPSALLFSALLKVPNELHRGCYDTRDHPGHYPFISHLTFRNICDIIIDNAREWFDPDVVEYGDTIYLNVSYLQWFVDHVHDKIKVPYILVMGDVGAWIPSPDFQKLLYDPKLSAWFCKNMLFSYHPKLFQIPMGQDLGIFVLDDPYITTYLSDAVEKKLPKKHLLYMNHFPRKYGDRDKLVKLFENEPYCFSRNRSDREFTCLARPEFYEEIASSKFVLSPIGYETDSVRTWEAMVLDCIPIVEHTFLDPSYEGLPVVMVHDWKEVNQPFLERKYEELKNLKSEKIYFDYWHNLIKDVQKKVKAKENSFSYLEATQFSEQDFKDLLFILNNYGGRNGMLFYRGCLTAARTLQLANVSPFFCNICVYDPWLKNEIFKDFKNYLTDHSLLKNKSKILLFENELFFTILLSRFVESPLFLDLTHYRTSLNIDFGSPNNFRQNLKPDLNKIYRQLSPGVLLCGNMANNDYVREILELFSQENDVAIERRGAFWFLPPREER